MRRSPLWNAKMEGDFRFPISFNTIVMGIFPGWTIEAFIFSPPRSIPNTIADTTGTNTSGSSNTDSLIIFLNVAILLQLVKDTNWSQSNHGGKNNNMILRAI